MRFKGKKQIVKKVQALLGLVDDGIAGPITWTAITGLVGIDPSDEIEEMILSVQEKIDLKVDGIDGPKTWHAILGAAEQKNESESTEDEETENTEVEENENTAGIDLILKYEVSSKAYYNKKLKAPTWPGGGSGVTIGIGYDLGYNSERNFLRDWRGKISKSAIRKLSAVLGVKGVRAKSKISRLRSVEIPYDVAISVFTEQTLPRFWSLAEKAFGSNFAKLHKNAQWALVSLVFNRGASMSGSRRAEMAAIRDAIAEWDGTDPEIYEIIATFIESMKRIWVGRGLDGLLVRRDAEAELVRSCV